MNDSKQLIAKQWRDWAEKNETAIAALGLTQAVTNNPLYNYYTSEKGKHSMNKAQHGDNLYIYKTKEWGEYRKQHEDKDIVWKHENAPWLLEPDSLEFSHMGYHCTAKRNAMGAWCGYVKLPITHPDYDADYNDLYHIDVHGGLTYSKDGEFGFDCAHAGDLNPLVDFYIDPKDDEYRNIGYAVKEIMGLAEQFKKRENKEAIVSELVGLVVKKDLVIKYLVKYFSEQDYALLLEEIQKIDGQTSDTSCIVGKEGDE